MDGVADWTNSVARPLCKNFDLPPWLGDPAIHASHRSNLLRKKPEWFSQFGWQEPSNLPYVWPVTIAGLRAKGLA